jgi:hypothetical protein
MAYLIVILLGVLVAGRLFGPPPDRYPPPYRERD